MANAWAVAGVGYGIWGLSAQGCSMWDLATGQQAVPPAEK